MKVSFAGFWLCGDPAEAFRDNPPASMVSKDATRTQQVVPGPGWENQEGYDRGNQWVRLSFTALKQHDTILAAEEYRIAYEALGLHPWKGTCKVTVGEGDTKQCVMHDALISPPSFDSDLKGKVTRATYNIQGPGFSAATDAESFLWIEGNDGDLIPTGDTTPAAGQAWEASGSDLRPSASIGTDSYWEASGSDWRPKA